MLRRVLLLGSLVPALWGCQSEAPDPPDVIADDPPVVADPMPPPVTPPGIQALRVTPAGRLALATGEEVPLRVVAIDETGAERDVSAEAEWDVRNPLAGTVESGFFRAGAKGSQATTVVARWNGLESPPLLVSTLTPLFREDFSTARTVYVTGSGAQPGWDTRSGALSIDVEGVAGDSFEIALPLDDDASFTNAERMLFHWKYEGTGSFYVGVGAKLGDEARNALETPRLTLGPGEARHASMGLNQAFFDFSYDARAVVLTVTLAAPARGKLVLDDVRVLRQFLFGVNLAWLDGAFGHDFGHDPQHPEWGVAYDPAHVDALLGLAQATGLRLLRLWVFERCEGLQLDADGLVTGIDPTLLDNFDDFVRNRLPKYDVKVYFTLVGAATLDCFRTSVLPTGAARDALFTRALTPFVARYADSPWVWGIDLMNEPEAAVAGPSGNYGNGTTWTVMRDFLASGAAMVRRTAPHLYVSAGSGWHGAENVRAGLFSGLGFTHLDWHAYEDDGSLPTYASLQRHARVLLGEIGQDKQDWNDQLQAFVLREMLATAESEHYWGVLPWYLDHPDSMNPLALIDPASSYGALTGRPGLEVLREFSRTRGDLGP